MAERTMRLSSSIVFTLFLMLFLRPMAAQNSSSGGSWRGPWLGTNTYVVNDLVSYNGAIYVNTVATAPVTTSSTTEGTNLFDINAVVQNVVIVGGDGTTAGIGGFESTGYVNIAGASTFITNMTPNLFTPYGVAFYDTNKVFVSGFTDQNPPGGLSASGNKLQPDVAIPVPSGAVYVRFWYSTSQEGTTDVAAIINAGSTLQSTYTSYGAGSTTTTTTPSAAPSDMMYWSSLSGTGSSSSGTALPSDLVYTDVAQTISGLKNFTGNVGIGIATPGTSLEVNGSITLSANSGGAVVFQNGTKQTVAFPMGKGFQDNQSGFGPSGPLPSGGISGGLVFNQHYAFGPFSGPHSLKIATLVPSDPGTADRLHLIASLDQRNCSGCNGYVDAVFANRNGFGYQYSVHGALPGGTRLAGYANVDGSVDLYLLFAVDFVSATYTVLENMQETVYLTPVDSFTATPSGTLVFDSGNSNYPPSTYIDNGNNLTLTKNLVMARNNGGSITFSDGSVQTLAWNGVLSGGDYAESVDVIGDRSAFEPGDVITIDPEHPGSFLAATAPFSRLVAGVYSTKPGVRGRRQAGELKQSTSEIPMAMIGIVPTKVSAENGPIAVGDLLVSSSKKGHAMRGGNGIIPMGTVIGKAIGSLASGSGVIEVLISLQ